MLTVGEKIRRLRKEKRITQEFMGEKLNVSRLTVLNWETDKAQPGLENIKQLCDYFGVEPAYFFDDYVIDDIRETDNAVTESVIEEVAVSCGEATVPANKNRLKVCRIWSAVLIAVFIVAFFCTVIFAFSAFDGNVGKVNESTTAYREIKFAVSLIIAVASLTAVIILRVIIKKLQK